LASTAHKGHELRRRRSTLAIWENNPLFGMWADMVDVITCAIYGEYRLRGVSLVRGVNLPSPVALTKLLTV